MEILIINLSIAAILAATAVLVRFKPQYINVLSEKDRKRMNPKKTGRVAFWGLMSTALVLAVLTLVGVRNELMPMFICIPGAIITAALIQCSIPSK
ncbi:MAG: hypothetical protein IKY68_02485 [Alistipes sp.]|nr:hypothetical protein [Alistipes sp.]